MYFYRRFPDAEYILTDVADEMLNVAKKRFSGLKNITFQHLDYTSTLPETEFDLAISALSIHHLENNQKLELFRNLKQKLPSGGYFINYDQFCCDSAEMDAKVNHYWIDGIYRSGLSETELARWQERRKLDRECSISQEITMLEQCGFKNAECIYLCGKFAVISAQA
jgi:ubiquinone/menaquinone biosynthesis C-methylase UbiE